MFHDPLVHAAPSLDPAVSQRLLAGRAGFLAYLRRRLSSPDEAEDVLQEFSLKVIRGARTAGHDETINAWLGQILRHTLIDHDRRRAVRLRPSLLGIIWAGASCPIPDDHIDPRRSALFMARSILREVRDGVRAC